MSNRTTSVIESLGVRLLIAGVIFFAALIFYALPLGNRPFFTRGEAREAMVVEGMYDESDVILPLRSREEIISVATKPPMFHWLGFITSKVMGQQNEFSIRFPSALCAAFVLALLFVFVSSISGASTAALAVVILASGLEWNRSSGHARVDMVFALGVMLSMVAVFNLVEGWKKTRAVSWPWLLAASAASVFAVLAKGPFGLAFPWATALVYAFINESGSFTRRLRALPWLPAILAVVAALATAGIWYWLAYQRGGQTFIQVHLMEENVGRFMNVSGDEPEHAKPFFYSVIYLFTSFFPFSLFLPFVAVWLWTQRTVFKADSHRGLLFASIWFALLFIAVTISSSKREVYLLPLFPALAYIMAICIKDVTARGLDFARTRFVIVATVGVVAVAFALVAVGLSTVTLVGGSQVVVDLAGARAQSEVSQLLDSFKSGPAIIALVFLGALLLGLAARACRRSQLQLCSVLMSAGTLAVITMVNFRILPAIAADSTPTAFVLGMNNIITKGAPLVQYKHTFFPAMYYWEHFIPFASTVADFPNAEEGYILVRKDSLAEVLAALDDHEVVLESSNNSANGDGKLLLVKYRHKNLPV